MQQSIISIITPSFNRADIINETAISIFNQTYPYWEWVIVDDGSTDNSLEVLERYAAHDKRVKTFKRIREPKGACTCRNVAVENSKGNYLIFLDTDDLLAPFCLEQRIKAIEEEPECDFIIFPMLLFKKKQDDTCLLWNIDKEQDDINRILSGDPICQGTGTIWKKTSFVKTGMWNEELLLWQDIELHLRSFLQGLKYKKRMDLLPDIYLRVSDISLSRTGFNSLAKLKSRIEVYTTTTITIADRQKINRYKKGIRNMGADLIVSAINSNYFNEARMLMQFSEEKNIFTQQELKKFSKYLVHWKLKLYKLPFINKQLAKEVRSLVPVPDSTLGTVKYLPTIIY